MAKENILLKQACSNMGGQASMARYLGVSSPTINQWVKGKRQIPAARCPSIEKVTNGEVTCEDLRPDVNWSFLRGTHPRPSHSLNAGASIPPELQATSNLEDEVEQR
ncbi:helix-turn-helix domain-containing protein [Salmonella enterica]|nr:Cro/Cl family transcriptional regulator [Salmonella enterica]EJB2593640.1 helix-turn-helix domain-containing protein [Salmonella enterica]ELS6506696.1 helix-turn-helix domain-containing protein [Salmonella enterica]